MCSVGFCCACRYQWIPEGSAVNWIYIRGATQSPHMLCACMQCTTVFGSVCRPVTITFIWHVFLATVFLRRLHFCCWSRRDYIPHTVSCQSNGPELQRKCTESRGRKQSSLRVPPFFLKMMTKRAGERFNAVAGCVCSPLYHTHTCMPQLNSL